MSHDFQAPKAHRGRAGHIASSVGGRTPFRAGYSTHPQRIASYRVYDGFETYADHDRKRAGGARRITASADLPVSLLPGTDAAAIVARFAGPRVRRLGEGT